MTRQFQLLGSELLGKVGHEVLEVLISEPKGSPDLTLTPSFNKLGRIAYKFRNTPKHQIHKEHKDAKGQYQKMLKSTKQ